MNVVSGILVQSVYMLPPLLYLDTCQLTERRSIKRRPIQPVISSGAPEPMVVEPHSSDSDEEKDFNKQFTNIYSDKENVRIFTWGLSPPEAFALLHQIAVLHAYQENDDLADMVFKVYQGVSLDEQLSEKGLFQNVSTLGALRAMIFLSAPQHREITRPLIPHQLAERLSNDDVPFEERAALTEVVLIGQKRRGGRLRAQILNEWDSQEDGKFLASVLKDFDAMRAYNQDEASVSAARILLDFVVAGLNSAFMNENILTELPTGTVLYHGSGIRDSRFEEEVKALKDVILSTSTDPRVASRFSHIFGGSILCLELATPVKAIVYSTLDRQSFRNNDRFFWNMKGVESEVLLPPFRLEFTPVPNEFCETRHKLRKKPNRVRVRQTRS